MAQNQLLKKYLENIEKMSNQTGESYKYDYTRKSDEAENEASEQPKDPRQWPAVTRSRPSILRPLRPADDEDKRLVVDLSRCPDPPAIRSEATGTTSTNILTTAPTAPPDLAPIGDEARRKRKQEFPPTPVEKMLRVMPAPDRIEQTTRLGITPMLNSGMVQPKLVFGYSNLALNSTNPLYQYASRVRGHDISINFPLADSNDLYPDTKYLIKIADISVTGYFVIVMTDTNVLTTPVVAVPNNGIGFTIFSQQPVQLTKIVIQNVVHYGVRFAINDSSSFSIAFSPSMPSSGSFAIETKQRTLRLYHEDLLTYPLAVTAITVHSRRPDVEVNTSARPIARIEK